jgi:hypothetical protein
MTDGFRLDPAVLRAAGGQLEHVGAGLGTVNGAQPLTDTAAALPTSDIAAAAAGLAGQLRTAITETGTAVSSLGTSASASASTYTGTDAGVAGQYPH